MTTIHFIYRKSFDKIIIHFLGKEERKISQKTLDKIIDNFKKQWKAIEKEIFNKIHEYSGSLPKNIVCYISNECPRKGFTKPLTIYLNKDIDKMIFSLIFHLNKIALNSRKDFTNRVSITAIACDLNIDIIYSIIALYNTIKIANEIFGFHTSLRWIKTFMLEETRKDIKIYEKIKEIIDHKGLKLTSNEVLDIIAYSCITEWRARRDSNPGPAT